MSAGWLPVGSLWLRDLRRFYRQPSRVFGAVAQPVLFWLLLGGGLGGSISRASTPGQGYFQYLFPGILVMVLLFTAIFATISVIEDRREGFLKSVLVSPVPRSRVVLGKALGSATIAFIQAAILLPLAPLVGFSLAPGGLLVALAELFILAFALSGLGLAIAWSMDSTQGFHAIMNFFLLPMWLLSGAFFPAAGAPGWLVWAMRLDPLAYGLAALRGALLPGDAASPPGALALPFAGSVLFAAVTFAAASLAAARKPAGGVIL